MIEKPRESAGARHMIQTETRISLPDWITSQLDAAPPFFTSREEKMRFVIALSRHNMQHMAGGPFAAAVFSDDGQLVSVGVNMVVQSNCSIFHAEIVAIALAQKRLGRFDLGDGGKLCYSLFASTEPCAMCFGAVHWSGVRRLFCGARDADARAIGFDEGPKMRKWAEALNACGIQVMRDVLRDEARAVLNAYKTQGGLIYNSGPNAAF